MARIGLHISVNIFFFLWMFLVKAQVLGVKGAFFHTLLNWGMWVGLFYAHGKLENALKHCDFDTNQKAYAKIAIQMVGDMLHFSTINSKNDVNQQKDKVGGVGLKNIRKRLALNYPEQHELVIHNLEDAFEVRLKIPVTSITK